MGGGQGAGVLTGCASCGETSRQTDTHHRFVHELSGVGHAMGKADSASASALNRTPFFVILQHAAVAFCAYALLQWRDLGRLVWSRLQ